jgi:hypothetical protein
MIDLPFKVTKRKPQIIYAVGKKDIPEVVKEGRLGNDALYYRGKIYTYRKNLPKHVIEHEIAHTQIRNEKIKTPHMVVAYLDDEVKADLLTYQRTGKPKSLYPEYFDSRLEDAMYYHTDNNSGEGNKYNKYETLQHSFEHLRKAYNKYYKYMPEQWQKDWDKYEKEVELDLAKHRKREFHLRPAGDYEIQRSKSGYPRLIHKKVVRKKDPMTGFLVQKVV